jgi:hypothetical protein
MATGIFDINTPLEFFNSIKRIFERYKSRQAKDIEDLLYVIMGLNHLREWIAHGYDQKHLPNNDRKVFCLTILNNTSYKIIKSLCEKTKHVIKKISQKTSAQYGVMFDDWPDVDAVRDFDLGPASDYFVDGKNIIKIIDEIVGFYENNWFNLLKKTP